MHTAPRMDLLESRRLLAFVASGASTINGTDFQSIDHIVEVDGGYVAAGLFGPGTDFGNGKVLSPRGHSDVFLTLVRGNRQTILTLGGESRQELRFNDDRVDFAAAPQRVSEDFNFGVAADARRADEYVSAMTVGASGKLYVAVQFRRTLAFDSLNPRSKTITAREGFEDEFYDSAVLCYDLSSGKFALERSMQIGGPFNDLIQAIAVDANGDVFIGGSFERNTDFDPTSTVRQFEPLGRGDAFVAKYSSDFQFQWMSQFGGDTGRRDELESVYGLAIGSSNQIIAGGVFAEEADFVRTNRQGEVNRIKEIAEADDLTDGFTMRLNQSGDPAWIAVQGGEGYDGVQDITVGADGSVFNVGYFQEEADLNPSPTREQLVEVDEDDDASTDLFVSRLDGNGSLLWAGQIAGDGYEIGASADLNAQGDLVIAGSFYGTADFDPSSRRAIRTTNDSDVDDNNQTTRDRAYAGFVAVYGKSNGKFRGQSQINGRGEEDVFVAGASATSTGGLLVAGRYRDGFSVADSSLSVKSKKRISDDYREDGYTFAFGSDLKPIV